jgi:hypothetical protein
MRAPSVLLDVKISGVPSAVEATWNLTSPAVLVIWIGLVPTVLIATTTIDKYAVEAVTTVVPAVALICTV